MSHKTSEKYMHVIEYLGKTDSRKAWNIGVETKWRRKRRRMQSIT